MLAQILLVLVSGLFYSTINNDLNLFLYCVYGGFISIVNALLIKRISYKQQRIKIHNASVGLRIMVISVITRLFLVALLVLIGLRLNFEPLALLIGLGFGQIGLIIDTLRNKVKDGR